MAPSLALVAFLCLQASLAKETNSSEVCNVPDDASVLLQTSLTARKGSRPGVFARAGILSQLSGPKKKSKSPAKKDSKKKGDSGPIVRPSVGKGPDYVRFGIIGKAFYGMNTKANSFTMDLVLTLKWTDKRTTKLIPKGAANLTLSEDEALKEVWLPQVMVTNRDIKKIDPISTAVMLYKNGEVIKVQRVVCIIKDRYDVSQYPFDTQELDIRIASTQYMSDAVRLQAESKSTMSGMSEELFKGSPFKLKNWRVYAFEDDNGQLKKSRGVMTFGLKRGLGGYIDGHLIPAGCIEALSCAVFWFPFTGPFVTPRMAMSIIAYLTFTGLAAKSDAPLPPSHPNTWNNILNQNIQLIMVVSTIFNVYTEVRHHITKIEPIALQMNNECKLLFVVIHIFVVSTVLLFGAAHWTQMGCDILLKTIMAIIFIGYAVLCEFRLKEHERAKMETGEADPMSARYSDWAAYGPTFSQFPSARSDPAPSARGEPGAEGAPEGSPAANAAASKGFACC